MADRVPTLDVVPVLATVHDDHATLLDLLPSEWEVLAAIDGIERPARNRGLARTQRIRCGESRLRLAVDRRGRARSSRHERTDADGVPLAADPESTLAAARRALAAGVPEEALRGARQIIGLDPSCVEARLLAARALRRLRRFGDAAEEIRRALDLAPDHPGLCLEQGFAALSRGDFHGRRDELGALPPARAGQHA